MEGPYKIESVHPFICPGVFLELDHQFFLNFSMVLEIHKKLCVTEPDFFRKTSFAPNIFGPKIVFFSLLENFLFNFY